MARPIHQASLSITEPWRSEPSTAISCHVSLVDGGWWEATDGEYSARSDSKIVAILRVFAQRMGVHEILSKELPTAMPQVTGEPGNQLVLIELPPNCVILAREPGEDTADQLRRIAAVNARAGDVIGAAREGAREMIAGLDDEALEALARNIARKVLTMDIGDAQAIERRPGMTHLTENIGMPRASSMEDRMLHAAAGGRLDSAEMTAFRAWRLRGDDRIVELARKIGEHWRDQEGVNGALLDELAERTKP